MDQQNKNLTLTRPSGFVTSLQKDSNTTIAKYSRYSPDTVEQVIDWHAKCLSKADTLERGLKFFKEEFTGAEKDKKNCITQIERELSQIRADLNNTPTPQPLGQLSRTYPLECEKGLLLLINDLRLFFQVDNMISTDGIKGLVPMIVSEYPGLSLEEITVCFAQAKKGYYGEVYNRLDGQIILKWIRLYYADKIERVKLKQQSQHSQSKADVGYREKPQTASEALSIAHATWELEKAKNKS